MLMSKCFSRVKKEKGSNMRSITRDQFIDKLINLQEGKCLRIDNSPCNNEDYIITEEGLKDLHILGNNLVMFHLIILTNRVASEKFLEEVENTHFPPLSAANDQFVMRWVKWNDLLWTITTVPMESAQCFYEIAPKYQFTINEGSPQMLGSGVNMTYQSEVAGISSSCFPLVGPNVYTLEGGTGIV